MNPFGKEIDWKPSLIRFGLMWLFYILLTPILFFLLMFQHFFIDSVLILSIIASIELFIIIVIFIHFYLKKKWPEGIIIYKE